MAVIRWLLTELEEEMHVRGVVRTCSVEEGGPANNTDLGAVAPGGAVGAHARGGVLYREVARGPT
jgi:hypothetical protein